MEDFLARIRNLIPEHVGSVEWFAGVLVVIAVYALGYFCGILPSLVNRKRRKAREQSTTLYEEILGKILEHDELYSGYIHESDSLKRVLLGAQISAVKRDVTELESRLAALEQRDPRHLPLRPLPVTQLQIE
jgi:hypothetical protein